MTSPVQENPQSIPIPTWKRAIQRPLNLFFYVGIFVLIFSFFGAIFYYVHFGIITLFVLLLPFMYWGYIHGKTDKEKQPNTSSNLLKISLALLGFVSIFGIYLLLALACNYEFWTAFIGGIIYFLLILISYVLGYYVGYGGEKEEFQK